MYLSEEQLRPALGFERLIPAIRQALVDYSAGRVEQPLRTVLRVMPEDAARAGEGPGWFAVMPAVAGAYMAVKTVTFFPANAGQGLPTHLATITLLRRETGEPLAVMDGRLITEMRTAAVSAVAVEALARPEARTLGIVGAGVQAHAHAEALRMVWPAFREAGAMRLWARNAEKAARTAGEIGAEALPLEVVAGSDVVVTVTSARTPVLRGAWLKAESLVVAVGAVGRQAREVAVRAGGHQAGRWDGLGREEKGTPAGSAEWSADAWSRLVGVCLYLYYEKEGRARRPVAEGIERGQSPPWGH